MQAIKPAQQRTGSASPEAEVVKIPTCVNLTNEMTSFYAGLKKLNSFDETAVNAIS